MAEVDTVQIEDGQGGYIVINAEDFNPAEHKRFNPRKSASPSPSPSPAPSPAPTPAVESPLSGEQEVRVQQLEAIYESEGYRGIQAIATPLGIEKPAGGWRDAIPLIVEAESAG
ncbi:MAG: hypothetical protein HC878_03500 [Leptolyngbyaceae cyanobacterium SL_5_14]|nr:hypothetical protein [Leptolyngbyaceae cyanobacterium SL_5_14]